MFYLLVAAIPLTAALGLVSVARLVDCAADGGRTGVRLAQSLALSVALALLVVGAAVASPLA